MQLAEKKQSALLKFLNYLWGPIPWMIEVAAALSAAIGQWVDLVIISVLLLFNAVIGFWQEHQAANAVDALRKQLALKARVKRERSRSFSSRHRHHRSVAANWR